MGRIKFLRRTTNRYKKLGGMGGKTKNLKWRRPRGRDNKMRDRRRGYARTVTIGYGNKKQERGKLDGKNIMIVNNEKGLMNAKEKGSTIILGNIGNKKKIFLARLAQEKNIKIHNLNMKKFLRKNEIKGIKVAEKK